MTALLSVGGFDAHKVAVDWKETGVISTKAFRQLRLMFEFSDLLCTLGRQWYASGGDYGVKTTIIGAANNQSRANCDSKHGWSKGV